MSHPDPFKPGKFVRGKPSEEDLYNSRWASHPDVVEKVLAGEYAKLLPKVSEFIPTLGCTFRCPACPYRKPKELSGDWTRGGHAGPSEMKSAEAERYLRSLREAGCAGIVLTGGGEPTFHGELAAIIRCARDLGLRVKLYTNGTFAGGGLEPEQAMALGLDSIRVSFDTVTSHDSFHGYDQTKKNWLRIVLDNIWRLGRARKGSTTELYIAVLFDERNYQEIPQLGRLIAEFEGVDLVIIRPGVSFFSWNPADQVPRAVRTEAGRLIERKMRPKLEKKGIRLVAPTYRFALDRLGQRDYSKCRAAGLIGGVWPDGRMFACTETNGFCAFCIGDLKVKSVREVYGSSSYRDVIDRVGVSQFADCPIICRPTILNVVFDRVERFRHKHGSAPEEWIQALAAQHRQPNAWLQI